jgi:rubrerythrin
MERAAMEQTVPPGTAQSAAESEGADETLKNLQVAFNGESNARAKYLEYAKKADSEGYKNVGSLFRAAAQSEQIHAANHSEVIRAMGATPVTEIKLPEIASTEDNLKDALKGETYERDVMYTDFLKQARAVGNTKAVLTFNFAKSAETEHARLYASAIENLGKGNTGPQTFYVCPKCGFTTPDPDIRKCPVDFTPKEEFETVS